MSNDVLVKRDGRPMRTTGSAVRDLVKAAASSVDAIDVILPDESRKSVYLTNYGENMSWDERTRTWQASIPIEFNEYVTYTDYGTWGRVGLFTWATIAGNSWAGVTGL